MANDSCCDRCQDASLPRAITQWPPLFLRGYHAPIAESADPREIMDCHDALSITGPRTSTDTPGYPIKRTRRANHSSTVNPSPRVNPTRARGRNQCPLNEMRQRCTMLLAVICRRASLKNLVAIRHDALSGVHNGARRRNNKKPADSRLRQRERRESWRERRETEKERRQREEKDESFEDSERQKINSTDSKIRPIFSYRTYAKSPSYLSECIEFTVELICWNLALVTRNASLERAISPTAIILTCIIGINQPRNDCFKSCETTEDGFPHSREFTSPAPNRAYVMPACRAFRCLSRKEHEREARANIRECLCAEGKEINNRDNKDIISETVRGKRIVTIYVTMTMPSCAAILVNTL
ncbi:hypothetical protein ALC62_00899 [Cyphomyrmex costatus]|uniref:Uncharacterized protein n=1 Tax=Cyphomyrmex costatus TaxID=456900 RepID=A0A195D6K4_9HYME|nr:hypothetical protein ALC62_00899 [Cyphomyrmex costatus]